MAGETFDRTLEDIGNIVHLEHVNVRVPCQQTATQFYVVALGLTRDPYLMVGLENMWINVGTRSSTCRRLRPRCCAASPGW